MGKRWKGILAACCAAALIATAPGMTVLAAGMQEDSAYVFEGEEQEEATAIEEVMQEEAIPSFEEEEREEAAAIEEETQEEAVPSFEEEGEEEATAIEEETQEEAVSDSEEALQEAVVPADEEDDREEIDTLDERKEQEKLDSSVAEEALTEETVGMGFFVCENVNVGEGVRASIYSASYDSGPGTVVENILTLESDNGTLNEFWKDDLSAALPDRPNWQSDITQIHLTVNTGKFYLSHGSYAFSGFSKIKTLDLSMVDTSNAGNMNGMFSGCSSLESIDLSSFDTTGCFNMNYMFQGCKSLKKLDLSHFKPNALWWIVGMFSGCESLEELDLSNMDFGAAFHSAPVQVDTVFENCKSLKILKTPKGSVEGVLLPKPMYDENGVKYTELPDLSKSITLYSSFDLKHSSISGLSLSYGYRGTAYTPAFTVTLWEKTLVAGTDYTYKFTNNINPGTAKLTVTGKGKYTGSKVRTFEIVDCVSTPVSGKTYQLIPKNNSKTAVSAFSGKMVKNTKVYITDRTGSEAMKFIAKKNSDGTWKFINAKCELAFAVQQNSSEVGKGVVLYDQTTKPAQNWKLLRKSDNSFAVINSVSGLYVDMSDPSAVKGTTLSMKENSGRGQQRFYIVETTAVNASYDGTYSIRASKNKNYAVDIAAASKTEGANAQLYSYNGTNAQKFKAIYSGGGYYRFANVNSGLVLSVKGNTKADGTNVVQASWAGQSGQRWKIIKNSNEIVTLTNALGTVLHLTSNATANGTNIVAKNASTTGAQKWRLQK